MKKREQQRWNWSWSWNCLGDGSLDRIQDVVAVAEGKLASGMKKEWETNAVGVELEKRALKMTLIQRWVVGTWSAMEKETHNKACCHWLRLVVVVVVVVSCCCCCLRAIQIVERLKARLMDERDKEVEEAWNKG